MQQQLQDMKFLPRLERFQATLLFSYIVLSLKVQLALIDALVSSCNQF